MIQRYPEPRIQVAYKGVGYDAGYEMGGAVARQIADAFDAVSDFESFRAAQPWWMPYGMYQYLAELRARWTLEKPLTDAAPSAIERLRGMADGAGQPLERFYLFQAMELLSASYHRPHPSSFAACTAVAVSGKRTRSGHALLVHNFDVVRLARPMFTLRHGRAFHGEWLEFSLTPLAGTIDGMNEHGLCVVYDYAMGRDPGPPAPPISMRLFDVLAECKTVQDAISGVTRATRCGAALLMLADADGDVAAIEVTHGHAVVRRPHQNGLLFHSNAFHSPRMQAREVPRDALYADDAPESLRGKRIFDSPCHRDERLSELLDGQHLWDLDSLAEVMADHGPDRKPSENTICMHGDYWATHCAAQFDPVNRRLRISYGRACAATYHDFSL